MIALIVNVYVPAVRPEKVTDCAEVLLFVTVCGAGELGPLVRSTMNWVTALPPWQIGNRCEGFQLMVAVPAPPVGALVYGEPGLSVVFGGAAGKRPKSNVQ